MMARGKRVTVSAKLLPYIQQVMERFGLDDEAQATNLIIGACSTKPIAWLALAPGEAIPTMPHVFIPVSPDLEASAFDCLEEAIGKIEQAA